MNGNISLLFGPSERVDSQYVTPSLIRIIYTHALCHVTLRSLPLSEESAIPYSVDVGIGHTAFFGQWDIGRSGNMLV